MPDPVRAALPGGVLRALGVTGRPDAVVRVPVAGLGAPVVALTGVGKGTAPDHETLRRAAGAAARELAGTSVAAFALPVADGAAFAAVAEGALLGAYAFERYRVASADGRRPPLEQRGGRGVRRARPRRATRWSAEPECSPTASPSSATS